MVYMVLLATVLIFLYVSTKGTAPKNLYSTRIPSPSPGSRFTHVLATIMDIPTVQKMKFSINDFFSKYDQILLIIFYLLLSLNQLQYDFFGP